MTDERRATDQEGPLGSTQDPWAIIRTLGAEGWVRSPRIPTLRFSKPGWVTVVNYLYDPPGSEADPQPPAYWALVDDGSNTLRAWGDPEVANPLPSSWPADGARLVREFERPERHDATRAIKTLLQPTARSFLDGAAVDAETRDLIDRTLRSRLRPSVRPWVFACCDDFFTWLAAD